MLLLVITPRFRRWFRPPRPRDEMPMRPLLDVLLFWVFLTAGGIFGAAGVMALVLSQFADADLDSMTLAIAALLTVLSPFCFWIGYRAWWRLTR